MTACASESDLVIIQPPLLEMMTALTRQHITTSLVSKLGASSLTQLVTNKLEQNPS
jgi:hypothetical protein